jgi:hypothetical protein
MTGSLQTGKVILGEDPGTSSIADGVLAAVYYPRNERDHRVHGPNPLYVSSGPFPVLLYAHAFRAESFSSHPVNRDFTTVESMMRHVASYGCVCVVPDLSQVHSGGLFEQRGAVLAACYVSLYSLNPTLFANQLDLSKLVLVGHSRGGGGVTHAGRMILEFGSPKLIAYGLIAPEMGGDSGRDLHPLLVLGGTLDIDQGANPYGAYTKGGNPKTLVMMPGANHFGYTDICPPENDCNTIGLFDENGTISREAQQQTAAAYLAAFMRYFALSDLAARPYLAGDETFENYGATGLQVQSSGFGVFVPPALET